jgi:homoserine dehydrogenase
MTLELVLIGYGNVAKRFVALLAEQRTALARRHRVTTRVVGIATRHGQA